MSRKKFTARFFPFSCKTVHEVFYIKETGIGVSWSFDGMSSNETRPLLPTIENKDKNGKQFIFLNAFL